MVVKNKDGSFDLIFEFNAPTMNTTVDTTLRITPLYEMIKNLILANNGVLTKRSGIDDWSSGGNPTGAKINAIAPQSRVANMYTQTWIYAIVDDDLVFTQGQADTWTVVTSAITSGDTTPYRIAWGLDSNKEPTVYFANYPNFSGPGVIQVKNSGGSGGNPSSTIIGSGTFTGGNAVEFFLDKLFVGNSSAAGDRLYWTVTGDDDDWTGSGSGFLDLRFPGAGDNANSNGINGLRVYRNRLYILTGSSLHVLTGSTSGTFGTQILRQQNFGNGSTMYTAGEWLFYVDRDGIWQFNGTIAINIAQRDMRLRWEGLSDTADIDVATATWDDQYRYYSVMFPGDNEQWFYYYDTGQWCIFTYASTDEIQCVSPSIPYAGANPNTYVLGTTTNGKVFRYPNSTDDDGNDITSVLESGHISLGGLAGFPHSEATITDVWLDHRDQTAAITVTLDVEVDGTEATDATSAVTTATGGGGINTSPTLYRFPLPGATGSSGVGKFSGRFHRVVLTEATSAALGSYCRLIVRFTLEPQ